MPISYSAGIGRSEVYRDFEKEVVAARDVDVTRSLNPSLQTFDQWLARNKSRISLV